MADLGTRTAVAVKDKMLIAPGKSAGRLALDGNEEQQSDSAVKLKFWFPRWFTIFAGPDPETTEQLSFV